MSDREIVEWAPFEAKSGVTEEELLSAARRLQSGFLEKQPGFLRRDLLRGRDGRWVDVIRWTNQACVDQAMQVAMTCASCAAYFALMVPPEGDDSGMLFFDRIATWG